MKITNSAITQASFIYKIALKLICQGVLLEYDLQTQKPTAFLLRMFVAIAKDPGNFLFS